MFASKAQKLADLDIELWPCCVCLELSCSAKLQLVFSPVLFMPEQAHGLDSIISLATHVCTPAN